MEHILWFDQHDPAHEPVLGGKNTSLGILTRAGLPVPPGFGLSALAFRKVFADAGLPSQLNALLSTVDTNDTAALVRAARAARDLICSLSLPQWLCSELDRAYELLAARCAIPDVPVAVRSSATCEDSPDASFAGEHDTYLWIRGADEVRRHVLACWASLFTERAIAYRRQLGYRDDAVAMSVGVQQMVLPRAAGVAFTLNPIDGDRSQVAIDASWGLGETVVSGSVTPDNFVVDKVLWEITRRTISSKVVEHRLGPEGRVIEAEVEPARRDVACLTDAEVKAVARLARRAEKHYGRPQDVEWAIDPGRPDGDMVVLLQSRPETVWSKQTRTSKSGTTDVYRSIVASLLHPHNGRTNPG
jgi:pyruvate,water dikinase